jgi:hypothetical protein
MLRNSDETLCLQEEKFDLLCVAPWGEKLNSHVEYCKRKNDDFPKIPIA